MKYILVLLIVIQFVVIYIISEKLINYKPKIIEIEKEIIIKKVEYIKQELEYKVFEVTAYTAGFESTGKDENHAEYKITASGEIAFENHTIACPKSIPFGTKIYIARYNHVYTCTDRGSAITEGKLDIYIEDLDRALEFGRRYESVLVLPNYP